VFFFDPCGLSVARGDSVVVNTVNGQNFGECVYGNHAVDDTAVVKPLRPVVRIATEEDKRRVREYESKKPEALASCRRKVAEYGLAMKLINVEYSFDGNKLVFYVTAEHRVDFRSLVRDMATTFKTRIELRQIGVRDEARMVGGLGICGKPFCCTQFLGSFHPVSIKMAKMQGLSLNPAKISGACGRLLCCLKYEEEAYVDIVKRAPKADSFVETPSGKGSIVSVNLLRGNARVRLEDGTDTTLKTFGFEEMVVLGGKSRRAEYIAAKAEGRVKEAGFSEQILPELAALAKRETNKLDEVLSSLSTGNKQGQSDRPATQSKGRRPPRQRAAQEPQQTGDSGDGAQTSPPVKKPSSRSKQNRKGRK
jgi:cell fate regulator YaaT (PSP1 superfamily)